MNRINSIILSTLFVLLLFSGLIKAIFIAFNISTLVDLTFLLAILATIAVFIDGITRHFNSEKGERIKILVLTLFFLVSLSMLWTPSAEYSLIKYRNSTLNFLIFWLIVYSKTPPEYYLKKFIYIGTFVTIIFIVFIHPFIYLNKAFYLIRSQNLMSGLISAINILLLFIPSISLNFKRKTKSILIFINITLLFFSTSRGSVLGLILVLVIYFLYNFRSMKITATRILNILLLFSFLMLGFFIESKLYRVEHTSPIERSLSKFELLFLEDKGESINTRYYYLEKFVNQIDINLFFGHGFGSYGIVYNNLDGRHYPHNILLELLIESGFFTSLVMLIIFVYSIFFIKSEEPVINLIIAFLFLNYLKSFSFEDARIIFFFLAILLKFYSQYEKKCFFDYKRR